MHVTIEQANKLRCPIINSSSQGYKVFETAYCFGKECMFWEWDNKHKTSEKDTGHCGLVNVTQVPIGGQNIK